MRERLSDPFLWFLFLAFWWALYMAWKTHKKNRMEMDNFIRKK